MSPSLTEPTLRGSFRSQWARLNRTAPADARRFEDSAAPWTRAGTLEEFARSLRPSTASTRPVSPLPPVKPQLLASLARSFHRRAGTLTPSVQAHIEDYVLGRRTLRIAHQPNFLPSVNVVGQAAVCNSLSDMLPEHPVQIFLMVDYDVNTDRRYRHAMLPSISSHLGYHSLSAPLPDRRGETLIFGERKLPRDYLEQVLGLLHTYISNDLDLIRQICGYSELSRHEAAKREASIRDHLLTSFRLGRTFAEANEIVTG